MSKEEEQQVAVQDPVEDPHTCINCGACNVKVVPGPDGLETHCRCYLTGQRVDQAMVGCQFWRSPTG